MNTPPPKDPLETIEDNACCPLRKCLSCSAVWKRGQRHICPNEAPKDLLDNILKKHYSQFGGRILDSDIQEAKQQILTHYISYDEVLELIGEDEQTVDGWKVCRNQLRAELKAALKKKEGV